MIGWFPALMVLGPLLFAIILSTLGDRLHGHVLVARIVVAMLVGVTFLLVGRLAESAVTPRDADKPKAGRR